jgi:YrbI family 3-deoxy-D-manno-octulosonate 8-phosphate phosphatase
LHKNEILLSQFHTIVFDFDGVFTDNFVYLNEVGQESVRCSRSDGYALNILRNAHIQGLHSAEMFVLSTETNAVVQARCEKMSIACHQGVKNKWRFLQDYLSSGNSQSRKAPAGVVYFGNDLNDLEVMQNVGFSIAPSNAHPVIKNIASKVLDCRGGDHFVRQGVEFLLGISTMSIGDINELILNRGNRN